MKNRHLVETINHLRKKSTAAFLEIILTFDKDWHLKHMSLEN